MRRRRYCGIVYLGNTRFTNNWDLVDCSATQVVGGFLTTEPREPLFTLAKSKNLLERRIAIVSTQHFIRHGEFDETLAISELLLGGEEALIHKATGWKRDHTRVAATALEQEFGDALDPDELDELARSVARQWQRHDGHVCIFLDAREELALVCVEADGGMCRVDTRRRAVDLDRTLTALGLAPEAVPDVLVRLNLGQPIEFRDRQGCRTRLRHDPTVRRIRVEPPDVPPPAAAPVLPPFLCTNCTAVLEPWREGQRQQTCPLCGHIVPAS